MLLHIYEITSKTDEDKHPYTYTCKSRSQAWGKFCEQRFGVLKPSRKDWKITRVGYKKMEPSK